MFAEISDKIKRTMKILKELDYKAENISVEEFYDWMTGEIFSDDKTSLREVLDSDYLIIHEVVEISELKKMGRRIDKRVIVESPKTVIYKAHFYAQEFEMNYALIKKDYSWLRHRLKHHKSVVFDDPNLPDSMRHRALEIYRKFKRFENIAPDQ